MINLVKAELFRLFNRKFLYIFWGILMAFAFINSVFAISPLETVISLAKVLVILPVFLWPLLTDIIVAEEYKDNTYINTVAYGVTKIQYFLTKALIASILVIISAFLTVTALWVGASIAYGYFVGGEFFINFVLSICAALPLYIAAAIFSVILVLLIKKGSQASFAYWGLITLSYIINYIQITNGSRPGFFTKTLITTHLINLIGDTKMIEMKSHLLSIDITGGGMVSIADISTAAWTGVAHLVVLLIIGILLNRKWK